MARDGVSEVRERTDIVELVSSYVPNLKRTGRSFKGLCPFHQEKTPSFVVFPDTQGFHCFGCGKGGDAFSFYMAHEHVEFREALNELARRAGVVLSSSPAPNPTADARRDRLIEVNELATFFYANILQNSQPGETGRAVVQARGLNAEIIERFRLGFAVERWDELQQYLLSRGIDVATGVEAGLLITQEDGRTHDRFRGRLMFPIRDRDRQVVGFGARAIGDAQPKYLNSPQTRIFDKSALLYGLDIAADEIRRRDQVVIVEGYMDALAAHQFGHSNVVAAMGTAVTESQVLSVKRLSKRIVLALDADAAGELATLRGLETVRNALTDTELPTTNAMGIIRFERTLKAEISIVSLPGGKDPDELIRHDPGRWPEIVSGAKPFLDYLIEVTTRDIAPGDARAKSEAVATVVPVLRQISDRVVQAHYAGRLATALDVDERLVLSEIRRRDQRSVIASAVRSAPVRNLASSTEDHLLALALRYRELTAEVIAKTPAEDVQDARNRVLLSLLGDPSLTGLDTDQIIAGLDDSLADHAERLLASLEDKPGQFAGQIQREAQLTLDNLGRERFRFLKHQLQVEIRAAQSERDSESVTNLRDRLGELAARHERFYPPPSPYFRDSRSASALSR